MSVNLNFPNIVGTDTSDATATASDIAAGKTAYVNGAKVTGTKEDVEQDVVWVDNVSGTLGSIRDSSDNYYPNLSVFIKEINIPNGITSIGNNAFRNCISLKNITIPDSVTSISVNAFYQCKNLANIYYKGTEEQWNAITKTRGWNDGMGSNVSGGTVIHYNS